MKKIAGKNKNSDRGCEMSWRELPSLKFGVRTLDPIGWKATPRSSPLTSTLAYTHVHMQSINKCNFKKKKRGLGVVVHAFNSCTQEATTEESQ